MPVQAGTKKIGPAPKIIGVWAVSLNHKRRIFRSNAGALPFRGRRLPSLGVLLAATGGAATIVIATSLFVRSSEAPARAPDSSHISAPAATLAVVDGDTLRLGEQVVRLAGITAPARGSVCRGAEQGDVDCGAAAANALASLVRGSPVDCTIHGHDNEGRPVGTCLAGTTPLSETLVLNGWARAETADLRIPETTARTAGRGIWRAGS
jgi:endonuclease YncB( thermonuclease family)